MTSMSRLEDFLQPHSIDAVCAADRANGKNYILIDVGRDSIGRTNLSLERLEREVIKCVVDNKRFVSGITKLYVVGDWNTKELSASQNEKERVLAHAQEWEIGVNTIRKLIRTMNSLKELVWTSTLPFMASVFDDLPPRLTKLVLDLSHHVDIVDNGVTLTKLHIRPEDMTPLLKQTGLLELRLLGLRDSLQLIAWKTVYLNEVQGGMRVLELQMIDMPIIRNSKGKWHQALDVRGLTVAQPGLLEQPYKGRDGKGGLHWSFGYGEYLDGGCIRKAMIASGAQEAKPPPLQCLILDGFVIDRLPFEQELTDIHLLVCGERCIDAGMRAPQTWAEPHDAWSKKVNHACRILIQWPNWTGIFDIHGNQRDTQGKVVSQEAGLSTPYWEYELLPPPQLPPTDKTLNMKDIEDAFRNDGGIPNSITLSGTTINEGHPVGCSLILESDSVASSYIVLANDVKDSEEHIVKPTSHDNSPVSDGPSWGHKVRKSLTDSYWVHGPS